VRALDALLKSRPGDNSLRADLLRL